MSVDHNCEKNRDERCRCTVCGRYVHDFVDNDDGTFAASGKVATAVCVRCGYRERYYSDTGTVIDGDWYPMGDLTKEKKEFCENWGHDWQGDTCARCGVKR
ncbi:MAG: hypothetical protein UFA98_04265 [Ruminococcus sp.]|nr:hypothetical protein [Ruminococcus sp.]